METRMPTLLDRLGRGEVSVGMQSFSASPVLVESMGHAGLDFVILDMEHCPTGLETIAHLLRAAEAAQIVPLVRVAELDAPLIGRVLDLGARGIVLPHASVSRSKAAVAASRYAPDGTRGACPVVRAARYLPDDWASFASQSNREVMVVPLVEDAQAVDDIDAILGVDGVEVVFLGPYDLSLSMGIPGADYRHPKMREALSKVLAAANGRGKHVMTTVGATIDHAYAELLIGAGVHLLSFSADIAVFLTACRRISDIRSAATNTPGPANSDATGGTKDVNQQTTAVAHRNR